MRSPTWDCNWGKNSGKERFPHLSYVRVWERCIAGATLSVTLSAKLPCTTRQHNFFTPNSVACTAWQDLTLPITRCSKIYWPLPITQSGIARLLLTTCSKNILSIRHGTLSRSLLIKCRVIPRSQPIKQQYTQITTLYPAVKD